ncbi:MAG: hypothetical protein RBU37_06240 [Myxococcota bacterium]|jgi:hypothetical protein|nr:hypothetical protein [Myxococcota bacterium]
MFRIPFVLVVLAALTLGCGATSSTNPYSDQGDEDQLDLPNEDIDADDDGFTELPPIEVDESEDHQPDEVTPPKPDEDKDGIPDEIEGDGDPDGDGIPNYLDDDSDGDGIADQIECGPDGMQPRDTDGDQTPDFLDDDSDGNGISDLIEGLGDPDADTIPNYRDFDDDGDGIPDVEEIQGGAGDCNGDGVADPAGTPSQPWDCDNDSTPDYLDPDSDNDYISDRDEGYRTDTDRDGFYDRYDADSDGDGLVDRIEAGDTNLNTPPVDTDSDGTPDFRDLDSDGDGLLDDEERIAQTNPKHHDSDNDGVSDLVEHVAGTNPLDSNDNPRAHGNFFFLIPYEQPTAPLRDTLEFSTSIRFADIYFSLDRTGSMDAEFAAMSTGLNSIMSNLRCTETSTPCAGDGNCANGYVCGINGFCHQDPMLGNGCIADMWTGLADWHELDSFRNRVSLQSTPSVTASAFANTGWAGGAEAPYQAPACAANGSNCNNSDKNCSTTPGRIGCAGFRSDAIRIYIQITDADNQCSGSRCSTFTPAYSGAQLSAQSIKFIGLYGTGDEGGAGTAESVARDLGVASGTVNTSGQPFVYPALDAQVVDRTVTAVREIVRGVPLRVTIAATDAPGDDGDALRFIQYLEVNTSGTGNCTFVANVADTNGDAHPDSFPTLLPGTRVCWDVHPVASNTIEVAAKTPRIFHAVLTVSGDGSPLDTRDVYFLIPPDTSGGIN